MIHNYLITAIRNLTRQKGYSAIIILGLTISIAIFGLILQYFKSEHQIDRFNKNYDRIYRLETEDWAILGTAYGPELAANFPEIESFTRISSFDGYSNTVRKDDKLIKLENMLYADSAVTSIFTFNFIEGNPVNALKVPFSVVLTQSEATRIFGNEDPMGKMLKINNKNDFTVTGIIKDVPAFHLKTHAIASFHSLPYIYKDSNFMNHYDQWNYYTFFKLKENTDPHQLEKKIIAYYAGRANWKESKPFFILRPLKEIYFTHVKYDISSPGGNRTMLIMFLSIGIFILIIACVNFINLTTARAAGRSKEIGIRKVLGAGKANLVFQFLGEAILITVISAELSLVLMELFRPVFCDLIAKELNPGGDSLLWILILAIPFPVIIGFLAGIYPALYLNNQQLLSNIKKEKTSGKSALIFRRILITIQFTISIFLIVATLTVKKQLSYIREKKLGFDKEQVLNIWLTSDLHNNTETFRQKLLDCPDIESVAFSTQPFGNITWQESVNINEESKQYTFLGTEPEFIKTMGLQIIEGRNFDRNTPTDQGKVILNQEAVKYFNLKNPVGSVIGSSGRKLEVIGVMKDTYYNSLHSPIAPLVMSWVSFSNTASIRISGSPAKAVDHVRKIWNEMSPDYIFEYKFLDEAFDQLYSSENRLSRLFMYLAILAIFIASMGLLGLASYLAEQRTKEIGIRKVLGASSSNIIRMLSGEFLKWIVLSGIIALPLSWYMMNNWLNQFAYHTNIGVLIFITAWLLAMVIGGITVSWQSFRSATMNPVDALRNE